MFHTRKQLLEAHDATATARYDYLRGPYKQVSGIITLITCKYYLRQVAVLHL
jgi:hypothetical protein